MVVVEKFSFQLLSLYSVHWLTGIMSHIKCLLIKMKYFVEISSEFHFTLMLFQYAHTYTHKHSSSRQKKMNKNVLQKHCHPKYPSSLKFILNYNFFFSYGRWMQANITWLDVDDSRISVHSNTCNCFLSLFKLKTSRWYNSFLLFSYYHLDQFNIFHFQA